MRNGLQHRSLCWKCVSSAFGTKTQPSGDTGKQLNNSHLLESIDMAAAPISPTVPSKAKLKLAKKLLKPEKPKLSPKDAGLLEAESDELLGIISRTLKSSKLLEVFSSTDLASVLDVEKVVVNSDSSHVTVYWTSPAVAKFLAMVKRKHGLNDAIDIGQKICDKITSKLTARESVFRTDIMRHMDYRRVPRIFFSSHDLIELNLTIKKNKASVFNLQLDMLEKSMGVRKPQNNVDE